MPLILIYPLGIFLAKLTHDKIYIFNFIYVLKAPLGPFLGALVTDFGRFFIAGAVAATVSYKHPLLAAILIGILGPIIGKLVADGSFSFDPSGSASFQYFLFNMVVFTLFTLLGGLFYKFVLYKFINKKK